VRHVPDGTLRRFIDEPFAVTDRDTGHVSGCARCRLRCQRFAEDATAAAQRLEVPALVDADAGFARSRALGSTAPSAGTTLQFRPHRSWRLVGASLSTASAAALCVMLVVVAAAATLTAVFTPSPAPPAPVSSADIQEVAQVMGLNTTASVGGFRTPSGSEKLPFGTLSWTSSGRSEQVASLTAAEAAAGMSIVVPTTLPNGVGGADRYEVMPKVEATIDFGAMVGSSLSGSSLQVSLGPAVAVSYSGSSMIDGVGTLGILDVARPVATATGATVSQIESFLLSRPGVPPGLAEQIRLLGDLETTLPIPNLPGISSGSAVIGGSRAVVLVDGSDAASGAIWEDQSGVHAVAGLLDRGDLLSVARQIG